MAAAFVCSSGFFNKDENGSYSLDTSGIEKKAGDAAASAALKADEVKNQAGEYSAQAIENIKAEAAKINVSKDEIIADLAKPLEDIKTKAAAMDPAKLTAYLGKYSTVLSDTQAKVTKFTQKVKDLKLTEQISEKGKKYKAKLEQYTTQFNGLKEQAEVYLTALKGLGLDPAALGIDLSAYGL